MTSKRPSLLSWLLFLSALALSAPLILGFFGAVHPAFDSFGHFRMHLAVVMAMTAVPLLFTALRREGLMAIVFAVGALASSAHAMGFGLPVTTSKAAAGETATFKLLQFNMLFKNKRPEELVRLIAREHPDIITLQEVSRPFVPWLERLTGTYPYQKVCPPDGRIGGVAILSRRPWAQGSGQGCFEKGFAAVAQIDFGGRAVDVASLHLFWPWPHRQPEQVERLKGMMRALGDTAIVAGDFNAAPWSNTLNMLSLEAGATVHSPGPSWLTPALPAWLRPYVGLPIDHVLSKGLAHVERPQVAGDAGSDHLPVIFRFELKTSMQEDGNEAEEATKVVQRHQAFFVERQSF